MHSHGYLYEPTPPPRDEPRMAVLIEAINVVVPNDLIAARYTGGISAYRTEAPNATFCTDGSLTRVGFMDPRDVGRFLDVLIARMGVALPTGGEWVDIAVVDQFIGPTLPASWLTVGRLGGVTAAWLTGDQAGPLAAPAGWKPEDSASMTLWTTGSGGTVELIRETDAPPINWQQPQYFSRAYAGPSANLEAPSDDSDDESQSTAKKGKRTKRKKKKREFRPIKKKAADRAIYVDFEGRALEDEPPVLLGYCVDDGSLDPAAEPVVKQYLLDQTLHALTVLAPDVIPASIEDAVVDMMELSDRENRHLVSWSLHDRRLIQRWTTHQAFRYRNAIPTARRWRGGRTTLGVGCPIITFDQEDLQSYLSFIGYPVPEHLRHGAADWISTVRARLAGAQGDPSRLSKGGQLAWRNLLEHNRLDVLGMRTVVRVATGLDVAPYQGRQD